MMTIRIFIFLLIVVLCAPQHAMGGDKSCSVHIQPAKRAVESCIEKMRDFLAPELPEDVDTAGVDVFGSELVLSLSKGRLIREGGDLGSLRVYLVCRVDLSGEVIAGNYYPYEHWPPKSGSEGITRTVGPYIEQFYGESRAPSYSQGGSAPLATLLFGIDDGDVAFSKCIEVPDDWGD